MLNIKLSKKNHGKEQIEEMKESPIEENPKQAKVSGSNQDLSPDLNTSSQNDVGADTSHFDHLIEDHQEEGEEVENSPALDKDEFIKAYSMGFSVAGHLTGLQSLVLSPEEQRAIDGLGALYDTCSEITALSFMLRPGGKWSMRLMAMGALFGSMALGVSQELKQKREVKAEETKAHDPREKQKEHKNFEPRDGEPDAGQRATLTGI